MTALVAAFSLQDKIEQYGAYAGIAAVFGLGVLSLLYFAQAREVKRLRDWAGRAPERAAELEARVQADAQRRAAQQAPPAPAPAAPVTPAAQQPAAPGAAAPATAAAAAAGAAAATVAKPATGAPQNGTGSGAAVPPPGTEAKPAAGDAEKAGAGDEKKDANGNGNGKPAEKAPPAATPAAPGTPAATPPAAAAGPAAPPKPGAPGQAETKPPSPAIPAAATAAAAAGASRPQPAAPLRAPTPAASVPPRTPAGGAAAAGGEGRSRGRLAAMIGAGVAALVVVGVAAFLLFGGGSDNKPTPNPNTLAAPSGAAAAAGNGQSATKAPAKLVRKDYPLAILNGTTVTGLARSAADKLTAKGYNEPNVVTNDPTNQTRAVTQIYFEPTARAAALDVAKILGVKALNVKPMDANARALADRATVEVFIGADKAQ
jgi:LytR cell envelope-related transcriptional attenuator